jgi:transcription antitermination factor NusG
MAVVSAGTSPVPIPDYEISAFERAISANVPMEPCPYVEVGETVKVQNGPLMGVTGVVSGLRKDGHIVLSVSLLRRSVLVQVEPSHLSRRETYAIAS